VRRLLRGLFARALKIFFRRIEVGGTEKLPPEGPVLFVANHPNALLDPLLLLCFAPRPVSFLAKAPLFAMPLVGLFVRAFESIPVYRRQDPSTDLARNRETFESARRLLARGGSLALFPEGASHDEPKLLPMKTGAARIALGAAAQAAAGLKIVPAGLYYTWKQRFRSSALLSFGDPIAVAPVPLDETGEPPREAVRALTERIERALTELTLQAETQEALDLARRAERIFSAGEQEEIGLSDELFRRRRFVEGYRLLRERDPARLAAIEERIARFEAERRAAGLSLEHLTPEGLGSSGVLRLVARNFGALLLLPLAAAGAVIHYPAYRLAGLFARRIARREEDVLATAKVGSSLLLFPATWILGAAAAQRLWGPRGAAATLLLLPLSGLAALAAAEGLDGVIGRARALLSLALSAYAVKRLLAERRAIREEFAKIAQDLELIGTP
jgi:glycerol-3-phosphate O-acyltransferase/dihydroxyacetone phosphate acyltransferase